MDLIQKILEADNEFFLFLNSYYNDYWDSIMMIITHDEIWFPFFMVISFYIYKNFRSKALLVFIFIALTLLFSDQLSVFIKETVQRLRPVYDPRIQHLVHSVLPRAGRYSFVSSHATNSFAIFVFSSRLLRNRSYTLLIFFWALVFSYSRIYLGLHYPGDIICGALLGSIIGTLLFKMLVWVDNHFFLSRNPKISQTRITYRQSGMLYLVFGLISAVLFIIISIFHHYNFL